VTIDFKKIVTSIPNSIYIKNAFLNAIRDIHLVLSNNPDLSNNYKLDLCRRQRYLINLYFKQIILRVGENVRIQKRTDLE